MNCTAAIQGRLLDHDDKVRMEAVNVVCELAKTNLCKFSDLITQAAERLRDKKVSFSSKGIQLSELLLFLSTLISHFNLSRFWSEVKPWKSW